VGSFRVGDHPGATFILDPAAFAGSNPASYAMAAVPFVVIQKLVCCRRVFYALLTIPLPTGKATSLEGKGEQIFIGAEESWI
jgi:hypothetical protein